MQSPWEASGCSGMIVRLSPASGVSEVPRCATAEFLHFRVRTLRLHPRIETLIAGMAQRPGLDRQNLLSAAGSGRRRNGGYFSPG
jgi:hypothetical protein